LERTFFISSGSSNDPLFSFLSGFSGSGVTLNPGQSGQFIFSKNFDATSAGDFSETTFPISVIFTTNFGVINQILSGQNLFPITQEITTDFSFNLTGTGTFTNFLSWDNRRGLAPYSGSALPITITLSRISGSGDFTGIWQGVTGSDEQPITYTDSMVYDGMTETYSASLDTYSSSGIAIGIRRISESGTNPQVLSFEFSGHDTEFEIRITGN